MMSALKLRDRGRYPKLTFMSMIPECDIEGALKNMQMSYHIKLYIAVISH